MKSNFSKFAFLKGNRFCHVIYGLLSLLLLQSNIALAQDPAQYGTPYAGVPDPRDVNMYQVHIRPYSAAGNLAGVTARLDAIKALGTNVLYLMPFYPVGQDSRSSISPYCIKDFKAVGSEYGSLSDLRNLVDAAHSKGMAVMLDFVVNQTSWDHPWITQHPDWYVRDGNGVIQPLNPFPDVAALNFNNTSMRAAIVDAMRYWIFAANVDGYRCDYANNAPLDFWTNTISNLRGITSHKLLMFAEGDRLTNFTTGFDMNFGDKWYYDAIKPIAAGTSVAQIQTTTNTEYTNANSVQQVVRYTANHDTETGETALQVFGGHAGVVANFLVSAYMRGIPFLTSGQEVDFNQTIPWPYTSVKINWAANPAAAADFTKVLTFRNASNAIRRGTMTNYSDNDVCAFTKIAGTEKVVVITNLRNTTRNYIIPSALAGSYVDGYTGAAVTLTSGATQSLSPFQYRVLTNSSVPTVAVTGVAVNPASVTVSAGLTTQLTATVTPANASNQNISWTSSNNAVATVNATGLVTGVAAGNATITVTTQDGNRTASAAVAVTASSSFTVHFYKPANWGSTIRIYYWNVLPAGVLAPVNWPGVNMISEGNGWFMYTFTNVTSTNLIFNDGGNQTADLSRNSNGWYQNGTWYNSNPGTPIAVSGVSVSPTSATVNIGATQQLTATITPSNAANKAVSWSSSNTAVATVNANGLVTAASGGTATITVTTQDGNKTATASITVPAGASTYYQIQNRWQPSQFLYDGGNGQVKYGTNPGTNPLYQWSIIDAGGGFKQFRNRSTGNYMHVENQTGTVQCGSINPIWYSAQWSTPAATDGWSYIQNRWQTGNIIHVENQTGAAQYANSQNGWYSAQWIFVAPAASRRGDNEPILEIEKEKPASVDVFPNPSAGGWVNIHVSGLETGALYTLNIFDINGKNIFIKNIGTNSRLKYNLVPGYYVLQLIGKKTSISRKFIVQ